MTKHQGDTTEKEVNSRNSKYELISDLETQRKISSDWICTTDQSQAKSPSLQPLFTITAPSSKSQFEITNTAAVVNGFIIRFYILVTLVLLQHRNSKYIMVSHTGFKSMKIYSRYSVFAQHLKQPQPHTLLNHRIRWEYFGDSFDQNYSLPLYSLHRPYSQSYSNTEWSAGQYTRSLNRLKETSLAPQSIQSKLLVIIMFWKRPTP